MSKGKKKILKGYEVYLQDYLQTGKNQIKYRRMVEHFITWIEQENHNQISYTEMMAYIRHCQDEDKKPGIINRYLRAVRLFFDYLNETKSDYLNPIRDYNPAKDIQIKGVYHKIRPDYLDEKELDDLYESYQGKHKILLGLYIYQGLKVGEAGPLKKIHFDLKKGTVYIPKTIKGNHRALKLASIQVYDLMEHISGLKVDSLLGSPLQNQSQRLCKQLREINSKVRNSHHLRGSRISYWVRNYNIREAQYLAGHLSVASTEKYRQVNLENLQAQVNKYHPFASIKLTLNNVIFAKSRKC